MGVDTKIEWTHHTFNPWIGCTKVHEGCTHCYAEAFAKRYGKAEWGPSGTRVKTSDAYWRQPLKWNKEAEASGERRRVFCASLADVFEDWQGPVSHSNGAVLMRSTDGYVLGGEADDPRKRVTLDDVRRDLFALIDATPWIDWLLLTKRPENVRRMWPQTPCDHCDEITCPPHKTGVLDRLHRPNVWLGTSISDQHTADIWVPRLLECRDLVPVLFLSVEPLLGPVEIDEWLPAVDGTRALDGEGDDMPHADWVIVGGESGHGARPCRVTWVRDIVNQCRDAGVPVFVKQLGANAEEGYGCHRKLNLKDRKGGAIEEWPEDIRVREFPEAAHAR